MALYVSEDFLQKQKWIQDTLDVLHQGASELLLKKGRPLRIKAGSDPTAPDLHLGHTVLLNKMRKLQDLGHHVMFLIGDFTAMIGDPSGKNTTRPPLTQPEVVKNAETYKAQVFKILDPLKTEVMFNSTWMKTKSAADLIRLSSAITVARMLERDDFEKRYEAGSPIAVHEFLYPIIQGYDSVAMFADIEFGGTDQKFNLLMGRELQKHYLQIPQIILTMPLLEGLDGVQKMSKSLGNFIAIQDSPQEMFGKVMSISDTLMWKYFQLVSLKPTAEIQALQKAVSEGLNPRDAKVVLAKELVTRFHDAAAADQAELDFVARFQKGQLPDEMPEYAISLSSEGLKLANVLQQASLVESVSEGYRSITQGAVRVNGEKIEDAQSVLSKKDVLVIQVGKRRFARVRLT
jgi:tyrosyl-tRNA synthetase